MPYPRPGHPPKQSKTNFQVCCRETIGRKVPSGSNFNGELFFKICISERNRNTKPGVSVNLRKMLTGEVFIKDAFLLYFFKSTAYIGLEHVLKS